MIFFNPTYDDHFAVGKPSRRPFEFHNTLPAFSATPLHSLDSLAKSLGVKSVFLKDESLRMGLPAFKILGASWAAYCVLRDRFPRLREGWTTFEGLTAVLRSLPPVTLYSATDGNHGRAVARVAGMWGFAARIYVPIGTAQARIAAIESEGAMVEVVNGTYDDSVMKAARDADQNGGILIQDNGWEGYDVIPRYVIEGYSTMLWEVDDALAQRNEYSPTHVVVQIGVGSFAEAVVQHFWQKRPRPVIIGVEPDSASCALESVKAGRIVRVPGPHSSIMAGMNCDSPSSVSFPVLQRAIGCFVSIPDSRAVEAMRRLAQHGIVSGETGAAGLGALLELSADENRHLFQEMEMNEQSTILLFSTEGATNPDLYRSVLVGLTTA